MLLNYRPQTVSERYKSKKHMEVSHHKQKDLPRTVTGVRSERYRQCEKICHITKKCCTKESAHQAIYPDTDIESENQVADLDIESNSDINGIVAAKHAKARYLVTISIGGHEITMHLDTGATVSIIPESTYKTYFTKFILTETKPAKSSSGDKLELLG